MYDPILKVVVMRKTMCQVGRNHGLGSSCQNPENKDLVHPEFSVIGKDGEQDGNDVAQMQGQVFFNVKPMQVDLGSRPSNQGKANHKRHDFSELYLRFF